MWQKIYIWALFLISLSYSQTIIPPGDVYGTWTPSGSPYIIEGDITIPNDSTLYIEPGVVLEFLGHHKLNVLGRLLAMGTVTDTIIFTASDTSGFNNPDTTLGGWDGILFDSTPVQNDSSLLQYCRFEYGKALGDVWYINSGGAICIINFDKVQISNCHFTHNVAWGNEQEGPSGGAVHLAWSDIKFSDNKFSFNRARSGGGAVQFHESNPVFKNNIFNHNTAVFGGAIAMSGVSMPGFSNDQFLHNTAESHGGGIMFWETSVVHCKNVNFHRNTSTWGGGIGAWGGDLYADDCSFTENKVQNWGGGIACDMGILRVNNCTFQADSSNWGSGGLHAWYTDTRIRSSQFIDNQASFGAGLHAGYSRIQIDDCDFNLNAANNAAAVHTENCDISIDSCSFNQNKAADFAGAVSILADTIDFSEKCQVNITNSIFTQNTATNRIAGLQIEQFNSDSSLMDVFIDNCTFNYNLADRVTIMRIFGNISDVMLSNSVFYSNEALTRSAGAYFFQCSGRIENCLFANNAGGSTLGMAQEAAVDIINCTFTGNRHNLHPCLTLRRGGYANLINSIMWGNQNKTIGLTTVDTLGCFLSVNYCDIQFATDSVTVSDSLSHIDWGTGNININPCFADTSVPDFQLQDISPCIGAGINDIMLHSRWISAPSYDIEGLVRPNPQGSNVDMGAYENPLGTPLSIASDNTKVPDKFLLLQNYPNPFNSKTVINYYLPVSVHTELIIYNIYGQIIESFMAEAEKAGQHRYVWDATEYASGIYFCRLKAGSKFSKTKKLILLR